MSTTLTVRNYNDSSESERIDTPAKVGCPLNKEHNLETIFNPSIPGINCNGDSIPCISKHLAVTNTYVMGGTNTEYIIINPNTHSDVMGYRYEKTPAGIRMIAPLKSPFKHSKYRLSKMVSAVIYCKSDTQSTTNVALSGVMSSMIMYDLPMQMPEFEELTRMSLLPAYGIFNVPLWNGTRAIFPPVPRKFSSGDADHLSLSEAQEHEMLTTFTLQTQSQYTFDGGFYTAASPVWVVLKSTVAGQIGNLRVTKDVDGQDLDYGPYGYSFYLWQPRSTSSSIMEFDNRATTTGVEVTLYSADPLLAPDMDPKLFMAITGTSGDRNIIISGAVRKQLVPTNDMLEITTLSQPYSYDPSVFEAANLLLGGPIPAVATYGEIPVPTMEEAASLATGHCSLATFAKSLVSGIKTLGISPANILRKGISWLSGLANKGVDIAERSGYASTEYETDPPIFENVDVVGYCMGEPQYTTNPDEVVDDNEIVAQQTEDMFNYNMDAIRLAEEVEPEVMDSDVQVPFKNAYSKTKKDFPSYGDFARAALMKQSGEWLSLVNSIGARIPRTETDGKVIYAKLEGPVTTYQPFIALAETGQTAKIPFMCFVKLTLSPKPPDTPEQFYQPYEVEGTQLHLSKKMLTTRFGSVGYDVMGVDHKLKHGTTPSLDLMTLLLGVSEWRDFFLRCRKFADSPIHIIVDFHTGVAKTLRDGSWLGALHACMFGTSPTVCFCATISNVSYLSTKGEEMPLSVMDNVDFTWKIYINNDTMRSNYPSYWPTNKVVLAIFCSPRKFASFVAGGTSTQYTYGWGYPTPNSSATIFFNNYDFSVVRKFNLFKYVTRFMPQFRMNVETIDDVYANTPVEMKKDYVHKTTGYTIEKMKDVMDDEKFNMKVVNKINQTQYFKDELQTAFNRLHVSKSRTYKSFWNVFAGILYMIASGIVPKVHDRHRQSAKQKLTPKPKSPPKPKGEGGGVVDADLHNALAGNSKSAPKQKVKRETKPPEPMQFKGRKIVNRFLNYEFENPPESSDNIITISDDENESNELDFSNTQKQSMKKTSKK